MVADWSSTVASVLFDVSWRAVILAALVWTILFAGRIRAAGVRHAVWSSVITAMLLMPILGQIVPPIGVRVPRLTAAVERRVSTGPDGALPIATPGSQENVSAPRTALSSPRLASPSGGPTRAIWAVVPLIVVLYGAVAVALAVRLIVGWNAANRLVKRSTRVHGRGLYTVVESRAVATPLTIGIVRPRIVLPSSWRSWPAEMCAAVLAHESAHIRRRDPMVAFIARLNCCVFWFHPVAWWLQSAITVHAEHACDEAGVREAGGSRRYAEILLDMATAVRCRTGRVEWLGVGVGGDGLLGQRIDRILRGEPFSPVSRTRKAAVAIACAAAIAGAVACRQRAVEPLREDPTVASNLAEQRKREEFWRAAEAMTREDVAKLEASLDANPKDADGWEKLKIFYQSSGQKVFGWNDMIAGRRRMALRLIDAHAEQRIAVWPISPTGDPTGYADVRARWLERANRADATAPILVNAATFLGRFDARQAEALLHRGKAIDPEAKTLASTEPRWHWSRHFGEFYGRVLLGETSPRDGAPLTPLAADAFAAEVRDKILQSNDPALLAAAGPLLLRAYDDELRHALGRRFLSRALELDPTLERARRQLALEQQRDVDARLRRVVRMRQAELAGPDILEKVKASQRLDENEQRRMTEREYEAVAGLPEADRLPSLVRLTTLALMRAESLQHTGKDASSAWDTSQKAAEDALRLAERLRDHRDYGTAVYEANLALGLVQLRGGSVRGAVAYLRAASQAPGSEALAVAGWGGLDARLVNYLLRAGERESVAEFLERAAELKTYERDRLLRDARGIREGRMPLSYQYQLARQTK